MDRRKFLAFGTLGLIAAPEIVRAAGSRTFLNSESRSLSFFNLHTTEKLAATYWEKGRYITESLDVIAHILRDHRNGEIHEISPRLLDTLCELSFKLENTKPFQIISGYRSPATNSALRNQGHNVAKHSLHMDGLAIDIRVEGLNLSVLRQAAISLKAGGVGYYPKEQFVHVDVGRIRTW
jgi:uncharacterized protein YcbK (DUF882 family)